MAKKTKKRTHRGRGRGRRMGAANNDMIELFLGAAAGAVGGYVILTNANILPKLNTDVKAAVLGGGGYFLPKMIPGSLGMGLGLGLAASAGIVLAKEFKLVSGVMAAPPVPNRLINAPNAQRQLSYRPTGVAVVNGAGRGGLSVTSGVMAGQRAGVY